MLPNTQIKAEVYAALAGSIRRLADCLARADEQPLTLYQLRQLRMAKDHLDHAIHQLGLILDAGEQIEQPQTPPCPADVSTYDCNRNDRDHVWHFLGASEKPGMSIFGCANCGKREESAGKPVPFPHPLDVDF